MVRGWLARKHFDDMLALEDYSIKDMNKMKEKDIKIRQVKVLLFMLMSCFMQVMIILNLSDTFYLSSVCVMKNICNEKLAFRENIFLRKFTIAN